MDKKLNKEVEALSDEIKKLIDSKMSVGEFIRKRLFEKYAETGDEKIKDIAVEYFLDKMEDDKKQ